MASRHRSRERALQILYLKDMREYSVKEATESYYSSLASEEAAPTEEEDLFAVELVSGVDLKIEEIDSRIEECSTNWRLARMAAVDRNLLRLALYDMAYVGTHRAVAIKEALQLAERFSDPKSVPFINGVLDALSKSISK
jgi:transcription antitermination protein NusB